MHWIPTCIISGIESGLIMYFSPWELTPTIIIIVLAAALWSIINAGIYNWRKT